MSRRAGLALLTFLAALVAPALVTGQAAPTPDRPLFRLPHQAPAERFGLLGGLAVSATGEVYALDDDNHRLLRFAADGTLLGTWGAYGRAEGQLNFLYGEVASVESGHGLDLARNGTVYVADFGNHRVQRFAPDGRFLGAWGTHGGGPGQLNTPTGLSVAGDGTVYVADTGNGRIQHFGPTGVPLGTWAVTGRPDDVAVAPDGTLFVADGPGGQVRHYTAAGGQLGHWRIEPRAPDQAAQPAEVTVAPDGTVFVLAWGASYGAYRFDAEGRVLAAWNPPEGRYGNANFHGLAIGPDGTVYLGDPVSIADDPGPAIRLYTPDGQARDEIAARLARDYGQLAGPLGLAAATSGEVYVADTDNDRVQVFGADGRFHRAWGDSGPAPGQLGRPVDLALAPDGTVLVLEAGNQRVQRFNAGGEPLAWWGRPGAGPGELSAPAGLGVAADGTVYVADSGNRRVQVFDPDGTFRAAWGGPGAGPDGLDYPTDVAVAPDGTVRVTDAGTWRVLVFSPEGELLYPLGGYGATDGQLREPGALAVSADGASYVTDAANQRLVRFDPCGRALQGWGGRASFAEVGRFLGPSGVAVGPDGSVYAGDRGNGRVQRFGATGRVLGVWGNTGDTVSSDSPPRFAPEGDLSRAAAMAATAAGEILVLDDWPALRIQRFDGAGSFQGQVNLSARPADERAEDASGLAVAPDGSWLVLENYNQFPRVHRLKASGEHLGAWDLDVPGAPLALAAGPDGTVYVATDEPPGGVWRYTPAGASLGRWPAELPARRIVGIAAGPAGDVYVAQETNIRRLSPAGALLGEWGGKGSGDGQFGGICDHYCDVGRLAVASDGTLYAADYGNGRIQRFSREGRFLGAVRSAAALFTIGTDGTLYAIEGLGDLSAYGAGPPDRWHVAYFGNPWLAQRPLAAGFAVDARFDWGSAPPAPDLPADGWSARLERTVDPPPGDPVLTVTATGGARVWVDDQLVLDAWSGPAVDARVAIAATGTPRRIVIHYRDLGGRAALALAGP